MQPGQANQQFVIQNVKPKPPYSTAFITLGSIQLAGAILAIIFGGILIRYHILFGAIGSGIWCGALLTIPAGFGIAAGKYGGKCYVVTYLVLSIVFNVLFALTIIGVASAGISTTEYCSYYRRSTSRSSYYNYDCPFTGELDSAMALHACLLIVGFIEFITLIIGAAYCCAALSKSSSSTTTSPQTATYGQNPQGQTVVIIQGGQQTPGQAVVVQAGAQGQASAPPDQAGYQGLQPPAYNNKY